MTKLQLAGVATAAIMAASLGACTPPNTKPAVDVTKEAAAISGIFDAETAGLKAKDVDKATSADSDDYLGFYPGYAPVKGRDGDIAANKQAFSDPAYTYSQKSTRLDVAASGDMATQVGTFEQSATNPVTKKVENTSGNWVATWRKNADGVWKLTAVAETEAPPSAPAAASNSKP